jgi:hypothetical protein
MVTQDIREVDNPKVGTFYWVPHVVQKDVDGKRSRLPGFIKDGTAPCIGPLHSDPELGLPLLHWHYDTRFVADYRKVGGLVLNIDRFQEGDGKGIVEHNTKIIRRKMKGAPCRMIIHNFTIQRIAHPEQMIKVGIDGRPGCFTCPHRGAVMDNSHRHDLVYVCPLHGLEFPSQ